MKKHSSFSNSQESSRKETKPMRRESREVMSELVAQLTKQLDGEGVSVAGEDRGMDDGRETEPGSFDGGSRSGGPVEQLLHPGTGWGNADGGSVQDESAGGSGVLSRSVPIACGDRSGNAFGVGAGGDRRTWP